MLQLIIIMMTMTRNVSRCKVFLECVDTSIIKVMIKTEANEHTHTRANTTNRVLFLKNLHPVNLRFNNHRLLTQHELSLIVQSLSTMTNILF